MRAFQTTLCLLAAAASAQKNLAAPTVTHVPQSKGYVPQSPFVIPLPHSKKGTPVLAQPTVHKKSEAIALPPPTKKSAPLPQPITKAVQNVLPVTKAAPVLPAPVTKQAAPIPQPVMKAAPINIAPVTKKAAPVIQPITKKAAPIAVPPPTKKAAPIQQFVAPIPLMQRPTMLTKPVQRLTSKQHPMKTLKKKRFTVTLTTKE